MLLSGWLHHHAAGGTWVRAEEELTAREPMRGARESPVLSCPLCVHLQLSIIKLKIQSVCISRFRSAISPKTSPQTQSKSLKAKSTVSASGTPQDPGKWLNLSGSTCPPANLPVPSSPHLPPPHPSWRKELVLVFPPPSRC